MKNTPPSPQKWFNLRDQFNSHVSKKKNANGCLLWVGAKYRSGHGTMKVGGRGGKLVRAHRAAWILERGPIPDGLCVCHKCDVPACVNVDHLFLGTQRDNMRDMRAKGRTSPGQTLPTKLTEVQVRAIRAEAANRTRSFRRIGTDYGVTEHTIRAVIYRWSWKHVA